MCVAIWLYRTANKNKLGMLFGVTIPCVLSIFSVLLFLRLGFTLGQAGFMATLGMLAIGYTVVVTTVLSISAIVTSATVEGGGVYFLVSRSVGPEFGGAIGVIFYVANIFGCASYVTGFVEAAESNLGKGGSLLEAGNTGLDALLPGDPYWRDFLYTTAVLVFCLVVVLVGANLFAKTTAIIFVLVFVAIFSALFSFGFSGEKDISPPSDNCIWKAMHGNATLAYTGFAWSTFTSNLLPNFTTDYTVVANDCTGATNPVDFQYVFAIFFNGCIGIMAGVNISGDLKDPSHSIPQGTLFALAITFGIYILLFTFSAFTCTRDLLIHNVNYLQPINAVPPLITIGVFAITLSASLSNLIGATKILHAVAKDKLFGNILRPFTWTVGKSKQPFMAVLFSWFIVQLLLFLGSLNAIARLTTIFFITSYGAVNLACFILKMTSAPNFRPTFEFHAKITSAIGFVSSFVMIFFIDWRFSTVCLLMLFIIAAYLLIRGPVTSWGEVSQALFYHLIRKLLLQLDSRKSHVRFWRPEVLLLVSNPRSAYHLIEFTNDLKKGGLYVLGHVIAKPFNTEAAHQYTTQLQTWLRFVDVSNVKGFVELVISPSVRIGVQSLLATAGLGGMKPNTLVLGFYSQDLPINTLDTLHRRLLRKSKVLQYIFREKPLEKLDFVNRELPSLRTNLEGQELGAEEYVSLIQDGITMGKNICVMRHFETFDKSMLKARPFIDVWPLHVTKNGEFLDNTCLLMLQLACILHKKDKWKATSIRVFLIVENDAKEERRLFQELLKSARIEASIQVVEPGCPNDGLANVELSATPRAANAISSFSPVSGKDYYEAINTIISSYSQNAGMIFTALPKVPPSLSSAGLFIDDLTTLSANTGAIVMVHGTTQVMTL
ncbi:hypothetical protein EMCRGX_G023970 [Ephydatia muelleri]